MQTRRTPTLLSLIGVVLILPQVLTMTTLASLQTSGSSSVMGGQEDELPHLTKRSITDCESKFDNYCMNNGKCILLLDLKEHHCECDRGFHGPRCATPELVFQPVGEEQLVVILFCVTLLMIGLGGALYFLYKWYKRNKFPRQLKLQGYKGVQEV